MNFRITLCLLGFLFGSLITYSQETHVIKGKVTDDTNLGIPQVNIQLDKSNHGTSTDFEGYFEIPVKGSTAKLHFSALGFRTQSIQIHPKDYQDRLLEVRMVSDLLGLDQVVITGTRDRVEKKKAPVVVHAIRPTLFQAVNSVTMSEALNYTPGVRLETNCQNCNTTQVRMNGLDGAYSQILINGRPIFSALNGVYGLEQIPSNMVERIEVVRGGGSALYGASAIGGTINVITKEPVLNTWEVDMSMGLLEGKTPDRVVNFNTSIVSDELDSGISVYGMYRNRDGHDYDGDGFTEIARLDDNVLGVNTFLRTNSQSKFGLDFMAINSYRRGGDHLKLPPHETAITEELDHKTFMGGLDYDYFSEDGKLDFSLYLSGQHTKRKDYYGGLGDPDPNDPDEMAAAQEDALNAYGYAPNLNVVSGGKLKYRFNENNQLTVGLEQSYEDVDYQVPGYRKITQQYVRNFASYGQYEWKPFKRLTTLLGARLDHVNVNGFYQIQDDQRQADVAITAVSPRVSLMYDFMESFRMRVGYGRGFRPPRAYDEDFEVGSADEKQTFIIISEDLKTEYSDAFTLSFNYDKILNKVQTNFLIEGFYTRIERPFTGVETGETENGFLIEEIRNGSDHAYVGGINLEMGISPSSRYTFQLGGTLQASRFKAIQELNDPEDPNIPVVASKNMMRTPNIYGYFSSLMEPLKNWKLDITGTYTGPMYVPHILNDEQDFMQIKHTRDFLDANFKVSREFKIKDSFHLTLYGGIQNIFDAYQQDFDQGAGRDSDYIYGPATPRSYFFGLKIGNL